MDRHPLPVTQHSPQIIPDWEKTKTIVVDPAIWPYYTRPSRDLRPLHRELLTVFAEMGVECTVISAKDQPIDIWIKDWGFIENSYFIYKPKYARFLYSQSSITKARIGLNRRLGVAPAAVELVLDGGNLVHNGSVAIVTDKILIDNPGLSQRQITNRVLSLGFSNVIIVPAEPHDPLGHIDGILRFVSSNVLLLNDYCGTPLSEYGEHLVRILKQALKDIEIVLFPWLCSEDRHEQLWSAVGVYINFVMTAHGIIFPTFGSPLDDVARTLLEDTSSFPVRSVHAIPLARLGGVLNCVTLCC